MTNSLINLIPKALDLAISTIYKPAGLKITSSPTCEAESEEYGACRFGLNDQAIAFRIAKITPRKNGQFVTLWKRPKPDDEIAPLDITDNINFVVVSVSDGTHQGQFVFNQKILLSKNIMSKLNKGGKRAFRVYPSWTQPESKQALKTQQWQLPYFFLLGKDGTAKYEQVQKLFLDKTQGCFNHTLG